MTHTTTFKTCPKCNGIGRLAHLAHVDGGVCFECDGAGEVESTKRVTTVRPIARRIDPTHELRNHYRSARQRLVEMGASVDDLLASVEGHSPAATILALLAEVPAHTRTAAESAFAALGLDRETLEYHTRVARENLKRFAVR
jgi:hypothetical protein